MSADTCPPAAARLITEACGQLHDAQKLLAELQIACSTGGALTYTAEDKVTFRAADLWHKLETIDDCLHTALTKLGD